MRDQCSRPAAPGLSQALIAAEMNPEPHPIFVGVFCSAAATVGATKRWRAKDGQKRPATAQREGISRGKVGGPSL